ncbi:ribosome maturation factor RimM [Prochlorothrix hollandica]|uniref:ribosome maturation factor RimM n=1 Tax=Prochlorothrix hollandica TaxID=1223 RepID=UPI000347EA16|nr:ribosome maturation factor RimM [Prochlorothrix hollandica]
MSVSPGSQPDRSSQTLESHLINPEQWLVVGRIVAPQGLRGEVRIYPESEFPERFLEPGQRWILRPQGQQPESMELKQGRFLANKGLYVVEFAEIRHREAAEALRGAQMLVSVDDRPPLAPGEFHYLDLMGLTVVDQTTQEVIGTVVNLLTAGHDLLEVRRSPTFIPPGSPADDQEDQAADPPEPEPAPVPKPSGRRKAQKKAKAIAKAAAKPKVAPNLLIPFVESIVPVVDLANGRIEITPPPGLLGL